MSNIVNKVKDAVTGHSHHTTSNTQSTTGVGQGTHGTQGTHGGTTSTTQPPHSSNVANKLDPRVDSKPTTGVGQGTHGTQGGMTSSTQPPHSSTTANKLDPRVDTQSTGLGQGAYSTQSTQGTQSGMASGTQPPHSSNIANKLDPRVTDNHYNPNMSTGTGVAGHTALPHETGHMSTAEQSSKLGGHSHMGSGGVGSTGSALGTGTTGHTTGHHGTAGPGLMQTDSVPGSGTTSGGVGGVGGTGSTLGTGHHVAGHHAAGHHAAGHHDAGHHAAGHHDAGHHGSGAMYSSVGSGTASRTAGPHDSNVTNKLDPRVDSDLDGSRTVGGNATHHSRIGNFDNKDPTDAAQVPPSVMSKHIGAPEVAHDDPTHDRARRHSVKPGDSLRGYGSGAA